MSPTVRKKTDRRHADTMNEDLLDCGTDVVQSVDPRCCMEEGGVLLHVFLTCVADVHTQ